MKVGKLSFLFPSESTFDEVKGTIKRAKNKIKIIFYSYHKRKNLQRSHSYFYLFLYCGRSLCALWFVSGQSAVPMSAHCGTVFGRL